MKRLRVKSLDGALARAQCASYGNLLSTKTTLAERQVVLPFFRDAADLSMLFSHYIPAIRSADRFATEFKIYGDFVADMIVGDYSNGKYLLIELEDGTKTCATRGISNMSSVDATSASTASSSSART